MIYHENRLLADNSHEISYLFFLQKLGKMSQNLTSARAVTICQKRIAIYCNIYEEHIAILPQYIVYYILSLF